MDDERDYYDLQAEHAQSVEKAQSDPNVLTCRACGEVNDSDISNIYCLSCEVYYSEEQAEAPLRR